MDDKQLNRLDLVRRTSLRLDLDAAVFEVCQRYGFGAVMQSASHQWHAQDPIGALSVGACYSTLEWRQTRHRTYAREWARAKRAKTPLTETQREARKTYQRDWARRKRSQPDAKP